MQLALARFEPGHFPADDVAALNRILQRNEERINDMDALEDALGKAPKSVDGSLNRELKIEQQELQRASTRLRHETRLHRTLLSLQELHEQQNIKEKLERMVNNPASAVTLHAADPETCGKFAQQWLTKMAECAEKIRCQLAQAIDELKQVPHHLELLVVFDGYTTVYGLLRSLIAAEVDLGSAEADFVYKEFFHERVSGEAPPNPPDPQSLPRLREMVGFFDRLANDCEIRAGMTYEARRATGARPQDTGAPLYRQVAGDFERLALVLQRLVIAAQRATPEKIAELPGVSHDELTHMKGKLAGNMGVLNDLFQQAVAKTESRLETIQDRQNDRADELIARSKKARGLAVPETSDRQRALQDISVNEKQEMYQLLRPLPQEFERMAERCEYVAAASGRARGFTDAQKAAAEEVHTLASDCRSAAQQIGVYLGKLIQEGVAPSRSGNSPAVENARQALAAIDWNMGIPAPALPEDQDDELDAESIPAAAPVEMAETKARARVPATPRGARASATAQATRVNDPNSDRINTRSRKLQAAAETAGKRAAELSLHADECLKRLKGQLPGDAPETWSNVRLLCDASLSFRDRQLAYLQKAASLWKGKTGDRDAGDPSSDLKKLRDALERRRPDWVRENRRKVAEAISLRPTHAGLDHAVNAGLNVEVKRPVAHRLTDWVDENKKSHPQYMHEYELSIMPNDSEAAYKFVLHAHYSKERPGVDDKADKVHFKTLAQSRLGARQQTYLPDGRKAFLIYRSLEAGESMELVRSRLSDSDRIPEYAVERGKRRA